MADIDLSLGLDPSDYAQGAQQVIGLNQQLLSSMNAAAASANLVQRGLNQITPSRAALGGLAATTTAAIAQQQAMSGLAANQAITGTRTQMLSKEINNLARQFPIGNAGARQLVTTITELGVNGKNSEKHIGQLSKTVAQMSGAVGEAAPAIASGMIQLQRAFGDPKLDATRFSKIGDAAVQVSKNVGASTTGVLEFSRYIAPLARQAGIGQTAVLGISAAFSRLGDDGALAGNAVNKMLADLNSSVRDGGPQLATYARIVGTTVNQFKSLYESNPAEALTRITEAIGNDPRTGGRALERLGLEGPRTQRIFQSLSQSGALRTSISDAIAAYGNGSAQRGSQAAYGGVADSLVRVKSASEQLAQAFGTPLLGPLGKFINLISKPIEGAASLAQTGLGSGAISTLAYGGLAVYAGRRLARGSLALAAGRLATYSYPARGFLGAAAGGEYQRQGGAFGRYLNPVLGAEEDGSIRPYQAYALQAGRAFRFHTDHNAALRENALRDTLGPGYADFQAQTQGGNPFGRFFRTANFWGSQAVVAAGNSNASFAAQSNAAARGVMGRDLLMPRYGGAARFAWENARNAQGTVGALEATRIGLREFRAEVERTQAGFGNLRRYLGGAVTPMLANARMAGQMGGTLLGGLGQGAGRLLNAFGGVPTLAIAAGATIFSKYHSAQAGVSAENSREQGLSINSTLDDYRTAAGRATDSTITMADQVEKTGKALERAVTSIDAARQVNDQDVAYAHETLTKKIREYQGGPQAVAAQINAASVNGLTPQDLQDIKVDLLRSHDQGYVQQVLKGVQSPDTTGMTDAQKAAASVGVAPGSIDARTILGGKQALPTGIWNKVNDPRSFWHDIPGIGTVPDAISKGLGVFGLHPFEPGGKFNPATLTKDQSQKLDDIINNIGQRSVQQSKFFGGDYARQEQYRGINEAYQGVLATGNKDLIAGAAQRFSNSLAGHNVRIRSQDVKDGDFVQALSDHDKDFAKQYSSDLARGIQTRGTGLSPNFKESSISSDLRSFGAFGSFFRNVGPEASRGANRAVAAYADAPQDAAKFRDAVDAMVNAATAGGESLTTFAREAIGAANKIQDTTDTAYQLSVAAYGRSQQLIAGQAPFQTSVTTLEQRLTNANNVAAIRPSSPDMQKANDEARQEQIDVTGAIGEALKQRLMVQYQYQVASKRSQQDYQMQVTYTNHDFNLSLFRADQDFTTQRERQARNFGRQITYSYQDYNKSRLRSVEEYNIQISRAMEDFHISRFRSERDFGIQMARAAEDSAEAMYDPYHRIQTQAVYDARNLLLNLQEQQAAIEKQAVNLGRARNMGLTNQSIQALGLNQSQNAQQLDYLLSDLGTDPKLADQINATIAARVKAGRQVYNDQSNKEVSRAKDDFTRQLGDQQNDFSRSLAHQAADFARQMGHAQVDFDTQLSRAHTEYTTALSDMTTDYERQINRAETDHTTQMGRLGLQFRISMARMAEDVTTSEKEIGLKFEDLLKATQKAMSGAALDWGKILVDPLQGQLKVLDKLVPSFAKAGNSLGNALLTGSTQASSASNSAISGALDPNGTGNSNGSNNLPGLLLPHATGGAIYGPGTGTSDDIVARLSNGEHVWTAKEVANAGGHGAVEAIRAYFADHPRFSTGGEVGYGDPRDPQFAQKYLTTGHAGGLSFLVNKLVVTRFEGLINELINDKYYPQTIFGYAKRPIAHTDKWSNHAYGAAIDVDPTKNPRYASPAGGPFALPGNSGDLARNVGLFWGGLYNTSKDYMHFEALGAPATPGTASHGSAGYSSFGGAGLTSPPNPRNYMNRSMLGVIEFVRDYRNWQDGVGYTTDTAPSTVSGNVALARKMAEAFRGWGHGAEWNDLYWLWNQESGFATRAGNPARAYGIPQSVPGSKMASAGADWLTNPATQIRWGLNYIAGRYLDPTGAVRHKHLTDSTMGSTDPYAQPGGWYGNGAIFTGARYIGVGEGGPEAVIPLNEQGAGVLAAAMSKYLSSDEARMSMSSAGRVHIVYDHSVHTYDQRNDFGGAVITVQSNDPNDLARKLEAKKRSDNLIKTGL